SHGLFDHQWWNSGYLELNYGLYPVEPNSRFDGPFTVPDSSPTILVVGTTYDPATPYRSGRRLVRELGQARLLTMRGDGHTASFGNPTNSVCVDTAVTAYLEDHVLPPPGTTCRQEVPFVQPPEPSQPARVFIPRR
ncbi:MAG TPA: alpha/beta hydrolase, partial [Solirubrobacteraceae bacterium]